MSLHAHYNRLWEQAVAGFEAGTFEIDPLIEDKTDNRFGITLLARPSQQVKERIHTFLAELQQTEPDQYYYPDTDLHLTVMSIISCYPSFDLASIAVRDYVTLLETITRQAKRFQVAFTGITASPSAIMVQGFPLDDSLQNLRESIRTAFKASALQQSIDKRYTIQTAHATVVRFRAPLQQPAAFLEKLRKYKTHPFGSFEVDELELVYNDWYQRAEKVQVLERFKL